jgi:hypothetical protein
MVLIFSAFYYDGGSTFMQERSSVASPLHGYCKQGRKRERSSAWADHHSSSVACGKKPRRQARRRHGTPNDIRTLARSSQALVAVFTLA